METKPQIYIHGLPARDLSQVVSYLSGDAHARSKVQFYDGENFIDLILDTDDSTL